MVPRKQDMRCQQYQGCQTRPVWVRCIRCSIPTASAADKMDTRQRPVSLCTWGECERSDRLVMAFKNGDELASLNIKDGNGANLRPTCNQPAVWAVGHAHDKPLAFMFVISLQPGMKNENVTDGLQIRLAPRMWHTAGSRYERSSFPLSSVLPS